VTRLDFSHRHRIRCASGERFGRPTGDGLAIFLSPFSRADDVVLVVISDRRLASGAVFLFVAVALGACPQRERLAPQPNIVARINDRVIEVRDVEAEIAARAPGFRGQQYQAMGKRKELLEAMVGFEVLAAEAERRGFGRDPIVMRSHKHEMVAAMLRAEIDEKLRPGEVTDADVDKRYRERAAEYEIPEQVRVSQVVVADEGRARKVVGLARAARKGPPAEDQRAFRELVMKYSEDAATRVRGGEIGTLTRQSAGQAPAVLEAALALKDAGQLSDAVRGPSGFHILKLIERTPAAIRPLGDVRSRIVQELLGERRSRKMDELVTSLRARVVTELYPTELAKVQIPDKPAQP
jgi:hypothetical protein